jgi:hypothetical protein
MALVPIMLAFGFSKIWQPILLFRPLIGISPFLYLIVCYPLMMQPSRSALVYAACYIMPVFMFGIAGYYQNIPAMKGEGAISSVQDALAYVQDNWQAGDVIYFADDGPMINSLPYLPADTPWYKMPVCGTVYGELSTKTRAALDAQIKPLDEIDYQRAWIFAPRSPLHPLCYDEQIADIAPLGSEKLVVDKNKFMDSGVWLVVR